MNKTLTRTVGEGVAWLSGTNFLIKFIGITYTVVVLSNVSVYEYGLITLAMSLLPLLGVLNLAGLESVIVADLVTYKTGKKIEDMRYLFSSFISSKMLLGVIASVLLNAGVLVFSNYLPEEALQLVQILSLVFIAGPIRSGVFMILNVARRFNTLAQIRFLEEIFKLALVSFFLIGLKLGPMGVILAFVITDYFITLLFLPSVKKTIKTDYGNQLFSKGFLNPFYCVRQHAKWSIFQSSLHQLGHNIRPWIIQFFLGAQAVGLYSAALGLYQQMISSAPLSKIISPIIPEFKEAPDKLVKIVNSAARYQAAMLFFVFLVAAVSLPWLLHQYFPEYTDSYILFLLLCTALMPDSFSRIYESVFHAFRLQKSLFTANVLKLIMVICLLPLAIKLFGLNGIALEFFLTQVIYVISRYRVLKIRVKDFQIRTIDFFKITDTDRLLFKKIKVALKRKNAT